MPSQDMDKSIQDSIQDGASASSKAARGAVKAGKGAIKAGKKISKMAEGAAELASPYVLLIKAGIIAAVILILIVAVVIVGGTTGPGMSKTEYLTAGNETDWNEPENAEEEYSAIYEKETAVNETAALIAVIQEAKYEDREKQIEKLRRIAVENGCDPDLTVQNLLDETGSPIEGVSAADISESENKTKVWRFLKANGYSDAAAAGIMGNIQVESGFNPASTNPSSKAYGLCQWYKGRKSNLFNFAAKKGKPASDINVQLDFLMYEFNHGYKAYGFVSDKFRRSNDIEYTTDLYLWRFEVPALKGTAEYTKEYENRLKYAKGILKTYSGMDAEGKVVGKAANAAPVSKDTRKVDAGTAIVQKCKELCYPYKTPKSKWDYNGGAPTKAFKETYSRYTKHKMTKIDLSDCGYFVETVVRSAGIDSKYKGLDWSEKYNKSSSKFKIVHTGAVGRFKLQPGDIIEYKKTNDNQHTLIYMGGGLIAEAGRGNRFDVIRKSSKYNGDNVVKSTLRVIRAKGAVDTTSVVLSSEQVRASICSWAKKIAADDSYKYYKMEDNNTCPVCHPGKGKKGWQCIGFVSAAYHHNGVESVKCAMDGLGNNSNLTSDTIESWRKRNGKDWDRIENPRMSQLVAGDVLICFKGNKYQHTALYVGNGMICDAVNEKTGIKHRKYSSLGSKVKYAYRYNGTAIGAGEVTIDGAGYVSREDFDILAAYSVSVGNGQMELVDKEESRTTASSEGEKDQTTYTDITGKPLPLYWFGKKAGTPNYKRDLKKKLSENNRTPFYHLSFATNSDGKMAYGVITTGEGEEIRYLKATLKERDVTEDSDGMDSIAKSAFSLNPEDTYVDSGSTIEVAIKGIAEETYQLLGDGMAVDTYFDSVATVGGSMVDPLNGAGKISSYFGFRSSPGGIGSRYHQGIDIAAPSGTHIYAAADGIVESSGWQGGYGNCLIINHGNGIKTIYAHQRQAPLVKKGQKVTAGQFVGYVGSTGNSTGPHLHFEYKKNGVSMDPLKLIGRK